MNYRPTSSEIAMRIYRFRSVWKSVPVCTVTGQEMEFGKVQIKWHDWRDVLEFSILIRNKEEIAETVQSAIDNFSKLIQELFWSN